MRIREYVLVLITLVFSGLSYAMTVDEVLTKLRSTYSSVSRIEYKTVYELFKTHQTSEIVTTYNGYVYRQGNQMYQKIHNTEFVHGTDFSLKINAEEQVIQLNKPLGTLDLELNLTEVLKECKEKSLKTLDTYYSVTLLFSATSTIPLSVLKIRVDKKDFKLLQLDLYYSVQQDFSDDYRVKDMNRPHLRIRFTDITFNPADNKHLFRLDRYIEKKKNYLTPSTNYKGYTLTDLRI